jgi:glycosyltransferase involved in cell wall biosynthesis
MNTAVPARVSVVIPTFNRAHVVSDALESVGRQSYPAFEIVVVDDGSTDDTRRRLQPLLSDHVRYVFQANTGAAGARNHGVAVARGELIAFLDSDDVWKPTKLERDVTFLTQHPEVIGVFSDLEKYDGERRIPSFIGETRVFRKIVRALPRGGGVVPQRSMILTLLQEAPIKTPALTVRRETFQAIGGFDTGYGSCFEDCEFVYRLAQAGRLGYIDEVLSTIYISRDSIHRTGFERSLNTWFAFAREQRERLGTDVAGVRAARQGMIYASMHLGWGYFARGRRRDAAAALWRGFRATGSTALLLRAVAMLMPDRVRTMSSSLRDGYSHATASPRSH